MAQTRDLADRTQSYALRVIALFRALPSTMDAQIIGKQLLRSGTSVGANYREARRSRSRAEFRSKLHICLQEIDEAHYWLQLLQQSNLIETRRLGPLIAETEELIAIFASATKTSSKRADAGS